MTAQDVLKPHDSAQAEIIASIPSPATTPLWWDCEIEGFGSECFEAATRGKARYKAWRALRNAGYKNFPWSQIKVTRASGAPE